LHLLRDLNPGQREAVTHVSGPVLVLAGAGSGKTRVLAHRIAYLLHAAGVRPHEILAVTFTNKAAGEMAERVRTLVGGIASGIWMGTFHSICARILRIEGRRLGISPDFTIYDDHDQTLLMKQILSDLGLTKSGLTPAAVLSRISWAKSDLLSPEDLTKMADIPYDRRIVDIYAEYETALRANNALDFDDLICMPVRLFKHDEDALRRFSDRFRYILIDEYQDTNHAQYEFVRLLSSTHRGVCAVGDDDQSIYRWRGADVTNLLNFERDFPEAAVVRLEQCYRTTKTILAASQAIIQHNVRRKEKNLWTGNPVGRKVMLAAVRDEQAEGEFVSQMVNKLVAEEGKRLSDFVVLYRTNAQSRPMEDAFRRMALPYVIVGGIKFYERKEIKDIIAYLRVLVNPRDSVSLSRIINVPHRGIGDVTFSRLRRFCADRKMSLSEGLSMVSEIDGLNAGSRVKLDAFASLLRGLREAKAGRSVEETIKQVADESGYLAYLKTLDRVESIARTENVEELVAGGYEFQERSEEPTLEKFLEEVSLVMDIDLWDDRRSAVSLMTLHNAKGLEFPVVFIAGAEEGLVPHHTSFEDRAEMEEERRLFYVGMTRAKERLFISAAAGRRGFRGWMPQVVSRFVEDIPEEYMEILALSDDGHAPDVGGDETRSEWGEERVVRIGTLVRHGEWGTGRVVGCEGYGKQLRLTVKFGGGRVKRLLARYANLEFPEEDM
jgi:DNA helicase-2/ATP-dependent DNA helicase PcrA